MRHFLILLTATLAGPSMVSAANLTPTEQSISNHVDAGYDRAVDLIRESVNVNSGTMNLQGVREAGKIFAREFEELAFDVKWIDGAAFNRAGHLLAVRERKGPKILLIGHLDTVFPADSPFQEFVAIDENFASGPGITDMKGGNVVMLQALRALQSVGALDQLSITVVLTGDEESSGRPLALSKKALIDAAVWADYAIGFEDGDSDPETLVVSRRGSADWRLTVSGRAAHSSQIFQPDYSDGAIYEAARILDGFRRELSGMELLTFNPGYILGGTDVNLDSSAEGGSAHGKNNVIAGSAIVAGDIRTISPQQLADAQEKMRQIVAEHLPMTDADISFGDGYPPMQATEGNLALFDIFNDVSVDLGYGPVRPVNPRNAGAADISFTAEYVKMAIDGVGLMGSGGHTVDEVADLRTLPMNAKRVALLLNRLISFQ